MIHMRPADAYMTHHKTVSINDDDGDGGEEMDSEDRRQMNRYFVPRSDGIDFTERDAVDVGNLQRDKVADLMNRWNYDPKARKDLLKEMPLHQDKQAFFSNMDKNIARNGGRFTPSWLRSMEMRARSLEDNPLYLFVKDLAGILNVNRVELLLDEQAMKRREESIKEGIRQTRDAYATHVRAAEVTYSTLKAVEERYGQGRNAQNALFGYYLPEIDIKQYSMNTGQQDIIKKLSTTRVGGGSRVNFEDIYTPMANISNITYKNMFVRLLALVVAMHNKTIGDTNGLDNLIGTILKDAKISGVTSDIITKRNDFLNGATGVIQSEIETVIRALRGMVILWEPALHSATEVLAYGVSTRGSGPSSEILFIDKSLRQIAQRLAKALVSEGRRVIYVDTETPNGTLRIRASDNAARIELGRVLLQPYIPFSVTTSNFKYWALVSEENRDQLQSGGEIDEKALEMANKASVLFNETLSMMSDSVARWKSVQLRLDGTVQGAPVPLDEFITWALRQLTYYENMYQPTPEKPKIAIKAVIETSRRVINQLRSGISLYKLAEDCETLYNNIVAAIESGEWQNDSMAIRDKDIDKLKTAFESNEQRKTMENELLLHVFLDVRFGFLYLVIVYNFVREMLMTLSTWLTRPESKRLVELQEKWEQLSNGATNIDELKQLIESPDVARINLEYLQLPENSGTITLGPVAAAAINDATNFVRDYAGGHRGFKTFTADEITNNKRLSERSMAFRQLFLSIVALKIVQNRRLAPVAYMTQMTDRAIQQRTQDLMMKLQMYRIEGSKPCRHFVKKS